MTRTPAIPIPQIQGRGALSPHDGTTLTTSGIVTAIQRTESAPGFYLQDMAGDGDVATSDALFVSTARLGAATVGEIVVGAKASVTGTVREDNQFTTLVANARGVKLTDVPAHDDRPAPLDEPEPVPAGATLPEPVVLDLPDSLGQRQVYLEAREGMLATLPNALVVGPTTRYGTFTAVDEKTHGTARDIGAERDPRHLAISGRLGTRPQLTTGDRPTGVMGPIGFSFGDYELQQSRNYGTITRGPLPPQKWGDLDGDDKVTAGDVAAVKRRIGEPAAGPLDAADLTADGKVSRADVNAATRRMQLGTGAPSFTIATMNAKDFFDPEDAPPPTDDEVPSRNEYEAKLARMSAAIRDKLGTPDMLALQEVENTRVLDDLLGRPELKSLGYGYALLPTAGHRSINPALLYRSDRVKVSDVRQVQKQVGVDDAPHATAGSESAAGKGRGKGRGDQPPSAPLFARQPLLVDLAVKDGDREQQLTVVVNHLISKFSPLGTPTDPIRIEQGKFLNGLVKDLRASRPEREVIVLGDLNDTPDSAAIKALRGPNSNPLLHDAITENVPAAEAYSFNHQGQHQLIDHILVTSGLAERVEDAGVRHYNADLPEGLAFGTAAYRATDHDTPYVAFRFPEGAKDQAAEGAAAVQDAAPAA